MCCYDILEEKVNMNISDTDLASPDVPTEPEYLTRPLGAIVTQISRLAYSSFHSGRTARSEKCRCPGL